jgi:hypothetical protein
VRALQEIEQRASPKIQIARIHAARQKAPDRPVPPNGPRAWQCRVRETRSPGRLRPIGSQALQPVADRDEQRQRCQQPRREARQFENECADREAWERHQHAQRPAV